MARRSLLRRVSPVITVAMALFLAISVLGADPPSEDRSDRLGKQIRCPACEGESIAESPSSYAVDMMTYVRELVDEGLSDQQVVDRLMASYPGSQLLDPPLSAGTVLLWLLPAAALATGAGLAFSRLRDKPTSPMGESGHG